MKSRQKSTSVIVAVAVAALLCSAWWGSRAESLPLEEVSHIHGIAVDVSDPSRLYLATHYGVWRTAADGTAERVSADRNDYMGFTPHPKEAGGFFGSGHPSTGGNAGFIASRDGARTWEQIAVGVNGPVDFHAVTVSAADPEVIYGLYGDIQVSRDGGKSWRVAGAPPADVFDIAASAAAPDAIYAATRSGLMFSPDAGGTWSTVGPEGQPASLVEVAPDGTVYAFVVGSGLLKSPGAAHDFKPVNSAFGDRILLHLAIDPGEPKRLFAVSQEGDIIASRDGGESWSPLAT